MRTFLPLWGVLGLASCSLFGSAETTVDQATSTNAAAVALLQSPPVPSLDGGGASVTGLAVYFGSLAGGSLSSPFVGIPGAAVTATDNSGLSTSCADDGNGTYLATSLDGGLRYDPGASYTFTLSLDGKSYVASGSAPEPETVPAFQVSISDGGLPFFAAVSAGSPYTLQRTAPAGVKLNVAFVAVNSLTGNTASATPTWSNFPQTPEALLEFAVDDSSFRAAQIPIPGSAFPSPGAYLVTLTAVNEGGPQSNDLFLGSVVLIGAGSAGILQAQ